LIDGVNVVATDGARVGSSSGQSFDQMAESVQ
jgi:hypothetical protein